MPQGEIKAIVANITRSGKKLENLPGKGQKSKSLKQNSYYVYHIQITESNWIMGEKAPLKVKGNAKTLFLTFLFGMHAQYERPLHHLPNDIF